MNKIRNTDFDKKEYREIVLRMMIPIAIQSVFGFIMTTTDTVMVGTLGETQFAAIGIANQLFTVFLMFINGIIGGATIVSAQYYGKRDLKSINSITGFAMIISVSISVIFSTLCLAIPETLLSIYTKDTTLLSIGSQYLRAVAVSSLLYALFNIIIMPLRCAGETKIPLFINSLGLIINTSLNFLLIFGNLGFPRLGVVGAGVSTTIARLVMTIISFYYMFKVDVRICLDLKLMFQQKMVLIKNALKYGGPSFINDFVWSIGITLYAMIMGRLGAGAIAAYSIMPMITNISFIIVNSLGISGGVVIGMELGDSSFEKAKAYSSQLIRDAAKISSIMTIIILLISKPFLSLFTLSSDTANLAFKFILVHCAFIVVIAMKFIIASILRSAGNTVFCATCDLTILYCYSIPLAAILAFVVKAPIPIVYLAMSSNELVAMIVTTWRYKKGNWAKNITIA